MIDTPSGLLGAISQTAFDRAGTTQMRDFLAALVATENPLSQTAETVPCVTEIEQRLPPP